MRYFTIARGVARRDFERARRAGLTITSALDVDLFSVSNAGERSALIKTDELTRYRRAIYLSGKILRFQYAAMACVIYDYAEFFALSRENAYSPGDTRSRASSRAGSARRRKRVAAFN